MKQLKTWYCALVRRLSGGKHNWRDGYCARCGRKQSQRKVAA
jgi:hypothetical protein